eukprot:3630579-Pyramimonas_sp.AAC.1
MCNVGRTGTTRKIVLHDSMALLHTPTEYANTGKTRTYAGQKVETKAFQCIVDCALPDAEATGRWHGHSHLA